MGEFNVTKQEYGKLQQRAANRLAGTGAIGSIAALVLSILGLAGLIPLPLAAISAIVLGASLFVESSALSLQHPTLPYEAASSRAEEFELGGGVRLGSIGGIAVIALGVLALLGIVPEVLLAAAVITIGASGILASGEQARTYQPALISSGVHLLASLAVVVLGILALTGMVPLTMILSGLLVSAALMLLSSSALTGDMFARLGHHK
jgi:hypothetical protein